MFIPRTLRVSLLVALLALTAGTVGTAEAATKAVAAPYTAAQVVAATNKERVTEKLAPLTVNAELTQAAQMKANDMVAKSYFAHYSPAGVTPWYWMDEAGYSYLNAGENLASGYKTTKALVKGWMGSPTHKANIMGTQYTETGIAFAQALRNGKTVWYAVQMFGSK